MSSIPTFRFAPSPNGRLHLGHAYSALLNERMAKALGGRFLVRLEDIDTVRCTPELSKQCLEDLAWLGLSWEEPVRVQSYHFVDYSEAIKKLEEQGLIYSCSCSRSEVAAASKGTDPDGAPIYPGTCRPLDGSAPPNIVSPLLGGRGHSLRLNMALACQKINIPLECQKFSADFSSNGKKQLDPRLWGDVILSRKDTPTSYHLSVVVDDALQGVTHVVRGVDLEASISVHVLLQKLLGLPTPLYHHHQLIKFGGEKLSKSKKSESLAELRAQGITSQQIRSQLGF
jgi:glutamyl-Q tRNA(Asp) synthetase